MNQTKTDVRVSGARQSVALRVVELGEGPGSVIPSHRYGTYPYRGYGILDYTCGKCDRLLAVGARAGMFDSVLIACGCGALNEVPR